MSFLEMRMSQNLILLPVFAQVLLTLVVMIVMGRARGRYLKTTGRTFQDVALATDAEWDDASRKAANNFKNQFETPVLFYAAAAFTLITRNVDMAMFALAWLFVATRAAHALIHVGSNIVMARGIVFLVGCAAILCMWVLLMSRVATQGF
jgi:hypothetical protein